MLKGLWFDDSDQKTIISDTFINYLKFHFARTVNGIGDRDTAPIIVYFLEQKTISLITGHKLARIIPK